MLGRCTPEQAGISQGQIDAFLRHLSANEVNMHSVLLLRGNNIFYEHYWKPFSAEKRHRMYSVTKTFVSVAVGCLIDEGKLHLDDRIIDFFPDKLPKVVPELLQKQTVRHMLMMSTCFAGMNWFVPGVTDRTAFYFSHEPVKPSGSLFYYDSTGSYILGVLVERVSGKSLLGYLREKVLDKIGGFENAEILETPDGTPWGDSAMVCTPRALMNFARFLMNYGTWDGERLLSEEYLRAATACQTDNNLEGAKSYDTWGYGYQIWRTEQNGFACFGMGGQYAICVPDKDFICVCTGDNQGFSNVTNPATFRAIFDNLLPEPRDIPRLDETEGLPIAHGMRYSDFARRVSDEIYLCRENPMGIRWFRFELEGDDKYLFYENAQGLQALHFGMGENVYGKFPQRGYSDGRGNVHQITDFRYDCAASAGWLEPQKLQIRVQVIDRYFGNLVMTFGFVDENSVGVSMIKCAEDFFQEYSGWMIADRLNLRVTQKPEQEIAIRKGWTHLAQSFEAQALAERELKSLFDVTAPSELLATERELASAWQNTPHMHALMVLMLGIPTLMRKYDALGIPDEIRKSTLSGIPIWMETCLRRSGAYGMIEYPWLVNHMRCRLFRIGRLNYILEKTHLPVHIFQNAAGEIAALCVAGLFFDADGKRSPELPEHGFASTYSEKDGFAEGYSVEFVCGHVRTDVVRLNLREWNKIYTPGDVGLAVHIPEGEPLDTDAVLASMRGAKDFYRMYFGIRPKIFTCESWLLDPQYAVVMPQGRIAAFMKLFSQTPFRATDWQMRQRVFEYATPSAAIAKTSLQKAIAQYYADGHTLSAGEGFILA